MVGVQNISDIGITSESSIWLYGSIGDFIYMFEKKSLPVEKVTRYMDNNADSLPSDDCFTNIHAKTNRKFRDITCLCDFFSIDGDTYTAWAQHRPNQVALRTSVDRLCKGLCEDRFKIHIVPVRDYCQLSAVSISPENSTPSKVSVSDFISQFAFKDENHGQEQAIRLVGVRDQGINDDSFFDLRTVDLANLRNVEGLSADLDLLIDEVVISPYANEWVANMLQEYAKDDFGVTNCIRPSSLS